MARIDAMPENPDSLAVLDRINRTDQQIERRIAQREACHGEEREKFLAMQPRACRCGVAECDPTGVRECEKGIRERRSLP